VPPFWWNQHKNQIIEQTLEKNQNWNHDKKNSLSQVQIWQAVSELQF
jgi:hypothetical protein